MRDKTLLLFVRIETSIPYMAAGLSLGSIISLLGTLIDGAKATVPQLVMVGLGAALSIIGYVKPFYRKARIRGLL